MPNIHRPSARTAGPEDRWLRDREAGGQRHGPRALAEVDLGIRVHGNRPAHELAALSRPVIAILLRRSGIPGSGAPLPQFAPDGSTWQRTVGEIGPPTAHRSRINSSASS
ncbi:hypothetical protein [Nocardia sp. NPDC004711]